MKEENGRIMACTAAWERIDFVMESLDPNSPFEICLQFERNYPSLSREVVDRIRQGRRKFKVSKLVQPTDGAHEGFSAFFEN